MPSGDAVPVPLPIPINLPERLLLKDPPLLPVPSLESSCAKYLESVRPLLNDEDFEETKQAVEEFLAPNSIGRELQKRLLHRAEVEAKMLGDELLPMEDPSSPSSLSSEVTVTRNNWLIDWWNRYSYLEFREPTPVNVNYFFVFPVSRKLKTATSCAAHIIFYGHEFKELLYSGKLPTDSMRGSSQCMQQYRYLFNACRIPKIPYDVVDTYDPMENNHVVVIRKNQFFLLEVVCKESKRVLSVPEIEAQLEAIVKMAGDFIMNVVPVGLLTADERNNWATNRQRLIALDSKNEATLRWLESASFVVCLDDTSPITLEELARGCWHGDGQNRWFDKSIQFIVFENGRCGFNGEHSMMDATPTARLCDYICEKITTNIVTSFVNNNNNNNNNNNITTNNVHNDTVSASTTNTSTSKGHNRVKQLHFEKLDQMGKAVYVAQEIFGSLVLRHDLQISTFGKYGKNTIKTFGVSPDAYVQMAIQLAYYKMFSTWVPTYETAGMRKYHWARTETCRSVTTAGVEFLKAMEDDTIPISVKAKYAKAAINAQSAYMADCQKGMGIDRHFVGLRLSLKPGEEPPSLFLDPAYTLSSHWTLSTSQIPSEFFDGYGWGEVVPDGFGIAYMVRNDSLSFNVTGLFGGTDCMPWMAHGGGVLATAASKQIPSLANPMNRRYAQQCALQGQQQNIRNSPVEEVLSQVYKGTLEANGQESQYARVKQLAHLIHESLEEMDLVFRNATDGDETPMDTSLLKSVSPRPPIGSIFIPGSAPPVGAKGTFKLKRVQNSSDSSLVPTVANTTTATVTTTTETTSPSSVATAATTKTTTTTSTTSSTTVTRESLGMSLAYPPRVHLSEMVSTNRVLPSDGVLDMLGEIEWEFSPPTTDKRAKSAFRLQNVFSLFSSK